MLRMQEIKFVWHCVLAHIEYGRRELFGEKTHINVFDPNREWRLVKEQILVVVQLGQVHRHYIVGTLAKYKENVCTTG